MDTDALHHKSLHNSDSTLSIDLHFGNIATYTMDFRCDGEVVDFYYDDDDNWEGLHSTMFRVGYDVDNEQQLGPSGISLPKPSGCIISQSI